jgi:hypothetical protein
VQNANSIQVGGNHYKTKYEHWDFAVDMRMRYLEGNATKYISRFVHKNGIEDLRKAEHYIDKIIELHKAQKYISARSILDQCDIDVLEIATTCNRFDKANALCAEASIAIRVLGSWGGWHDLCYARERVRNLIELLEHDAPAAQFTVAATKPGELGN